MKTSKKEKKFVVVFRQWASPYLRQKFTTTAISTAKAKSKFEKSYKEYEERIGYKMPFDLIKITNEHGLLYWP